MGRRGGPYQAPTVYVATTLRRAGDTGVQTHFNTLLRYAGRFGVRVELLTPFDLSKAVVYPAFGVGRLARPFSQALWVWWHRRGHYLLLRRRMLRRLSREEPAVVYAQDPLSARAALDVRDRGYPVEVALVVHYNISQADEWVEKGSIARGGRLYRRIAELERSVLPRVDRLIFPSRFMMEAVERRVGRIASVPRWCVRNFAFDVAGRVDVEPDGDLLTIGTLEARKNHAFLLHVLAHARRLGRRYRLTVVGDGPLRSSLAALAAELHLADDVVLRGYVSNASRLLPRHRAYVHAARMENLPITLIEALAAGRPLFAAPVGGIPEVFRDGVEGAYWNLDDPASAARALIDVLDAPDIYARMARAARARYEAHFRPERVIPDLLGAVLGHDTGSGARTIAGD